MSDETEDQSTDTPDVGDEWGDALKEQSEGETNQQEETASSDPAPPQIPDSTEADYGY